MRKILLQLTCILLTFGATVLWAQSVGGTLSGRITAANGTAVPNAAITVTNTSTNASQKALTGPDGTFSISGLAPGTYRVDVESSGYKHTSQQNIELTTTGPSTVNITLEAGNINETVEIKATAPMTQVENGEVSVAIASRPLAEIPIIDRNSQQFVGLFTGITPPVIGLDFVEDPARNRFYSDNGQFPYINQNYLQGVWNQEPYRNTAVRVVPDNDIEQLNISTLNLLMDKGYTGGGYIVDNNRGGTNAIHGDLFDFWSGNLLRSRDFFDTLDTGAPRYTNNQFGATVGGPIVRDKTFFFASYEGNYQRGDDTQISTVPMSGVLGGNFSGIPGLSLYNPSSGFSDGTLRSSYFGNVIPAYALNPTSAAIASLLPAPNLPGYANNYESNYPFATSYQKMDGRIDEHFSDHTSAFLSYGYSHDFALQPSPLGPVLGANQDSSLVAQNAVASISHAFGNDLITELRMGYNRYDLKLFPSENMGALSSYVGPLTSSGLVGISIPGMPLIGTPSFLPEQPIDNNYNWVWDWSLHTARHSFKWGVDIRRIQSNYWLQNPFNTFGPSGTAVFGPGATMLAGTGLSPNGELYNSFASFLLGAPSQIGATSYLVPPTIRQSQYGIWAGDHIHLLHHLDLDLGVRYDIFGTLYPSQTGGAAYYSAATNTFNYAGIGGTDMNGSVTQLHNIAPRIGLAYQLNDKTVIRGGYGIQYFQMPYMASGFSAPLTGAVSGVPGTYSVAPFTGTFGPTLSTTFGTLPLVNGTYAGSVPAFVYPHDIPTPYVETYSLQVQRDFYYGTVLSVGYVGNIDRHLPGIYPLNVAYPGTGIAGLPYAYLGQTASVEGFDNGLTSNYNSLQVSINKRFAQGLAFMTSYTYSKALGYVNQYDQLLDPFNLKANYGPLDWDRQQVLSFTHLWELPFNRFSSHLAKSLLGGWQWNGVFSFRTGFPLTVTANSLLCNCPGVNNVLASATQPSGLVAGQYGAGLSYFNNAAFAAPINGYGNLTRGDFRMPNFWTYDMSLFKNFRVMDRFNFQLRGEAYNVFNTTYPLAPITNISSPGFGLANFGAPSFVQGGFGQQSGDIGAFGRQLNVGLRVQF
jgi:hypothetical protein